MDLAGSRLGKYLLHAEIGRGDLGVVYRGHDPDAARSVAVKILAPQLAEEAGFAERFLNTVRAAAQLNHPHIVIIYDVGQADGWYIQVMEYLERMPLDRLLREQGPLSPARALSLLRQMADALDYAHAQGMVHGGVKPSNAMIIGRDQVKMTDFGFVRPVPRTGSSATAASLDTVRYVSPEQAGGKKAEAASDLYSLAVIAYEMLAGAPPFDARSTSDVLFQQVHEPPPSILLKRPEQSPALDDVFGRALAKQPEHRYWSGATFINSLAEALEDQSGAAAVLATQTPPTEPARQVPLRPSPTRRIAWGWFAGAALVLALIVVGALAFSGVAGRSKPTPTLDVIALLTQVPNPISTMTPTRSGAPVPPTDTPLPQAAATTAPTDTSPVNIGPGSHATVSIPVADVRAAPSEASELVTQVIMGEEVIIVEMEDGWYRIAAIDQPSPKDPQGYPGWIKSDSVTPQSGEREQTAVVIVSSAPLRTTASQDGSVIHSLSFDTRLALQSADDNWVAVTLPDGKAGWIARDHVRLVCSGDQCKDGVAGEPDAPRSSDEIVNVAKQFIGTRYLWGGTSSNAFDCSGFVYRVFHASGITVPRDSLPMSQSGTWVERDELRPGDVVFTAAGGPSGRVSHCALYLGDGQVLTTVGTDPITVVPLDSARYRDEYWGARRYP
jgi:serine/threonine protein kinase/uncharacterized protein YgiM (DUF1202 family)